MERQVSVIVEQIINVIEKDINIIDKGKHHSRFYAHLRFLASRIINHESYNNDELIVESSMIKDMKTKYPKEYMIVKNIKRMLINEYNFIINKDEQIYLLMYINLIEA